MKKLAPVVLLSFALSACGSDPAPEPTEQIVVKEPGGSNEAAAEDTATEAAATEEVAAGDASIADGKAAFVQCAVCHSIEKGGPAKIGPNLHGVAGRKAASVAGFQYSSAMKDSGITWTDEELDAYIAGPLKKLPGTKMASAGIQDADKRAAVIAYMKDASSN